jgi:GNAT superfamily N-acetyltransferase
VSRTFVAIDPHSPTPTRIIAYFTLSACEGITVGLPPKLAKRLPRTIPAVLLGRLAVDREHQGRGFGGTLLAEAIRRVAVTSQEIGIAGMFVDAKDDAAAAFYRKFGFVPLASNPHRLFLPLETLLEVARQ